MFPLQQPFGHEVASQTHWPVLVLHSWPVAHAAHAAPPAPHEVFDSLESGSHVVPPLQQPAHEPPPHEHVPFEHESPVPHALHAAPPVPHEELDWEEYGTQVVPLQQPLGHEVASQTHCPLVLLHSWPVAHEPQLAPPVPHEALDCETNASHVPPVPPLQQPFGQVLASHEQVPLAVSQTLFAQAVQAAPPVPHWEPDCDA